MRTSFLGPRPRFYPPPDLNNLHPTIKFTSEQSSSSVAFLDTTVSIKDGKISTDLHVKTNDTHQYLLSSSCHPYHTKRSIPYSLGLRLSRICSDDTAFNKRCNELAEHLKKRGYKEKLILLEINKAKQVPRDQALKPSVPKNKCNQGIPFVVTYNPASPNLNTIISKHFPNKVGKKVLKKIMSSYLKTGLKNNNFKQVSSGIKKKHVYFLSLFQAFRLWSASEK